MQDMIAHTFNAVAIPQRPADGYLDATAACKACGKKFNDYSRLASTQEFLAELARDTGIQISVAGNPVTETEFPFPEFQGTENGFPVPALLHNIQGGIPELQGTWVHPYVAIHLAQWLSPKFAVQVTKWVFEWMTTGKTPVTFTREDFIGEKERLFLFLSQMLHDDLLDEVADLRDEVRAMRSLLETPHRELLPQSTGNPSAPRVPIHVLTYQERAIRLFSVADVLWVVAQDILMILGQKVNLSGIPSTLRTLRLHPDQDFQTMACSALATHYHLSLAALREAARLPKSWNTITLVSVTGLQRLQYQSSNLPFWIWCWARLEPFYHSPKR